MCSGRLCTSAHQLGSACMEKAAEDTARCVPEPQHGGHTQGSLASAAGDTGGQEQRVVQNYSSKAAVEEIDFQHSGLAILN